MKNKVLISAIIASFLMLYNCQAPYIKQFPLTKDHDEEEEIEIIVPDDIIPEESINDPQQTGVSCHSFSRTNSNTEIIEVIEIPQDLPKNYDLSDDMPPVRSQGSQGSCVGWATTYYLKSYQEKIQYGYEYTSYKDVMSPAFVYNQINDYENCNSGSRIEDALSVLKTHGTNNWEEFPYSDAYCSNLPTEDLLRTAAQNKIKEYFHVGIPHDNTDENYTLINLIKTLVSQKNPIVISMDIDNMPFHDENGNFITNAYSLNPVDSSCGHALLIVGYDDQLNAFKFVNSWGTNWGNEGYAWINYNFFLPEDDSNFEKGITGAYVAFDDKGLTIHIDN